MNSPSHRANIVRSDFTEIGVGIAKGTYQGRNTIFVAQFFGKPLTAFAAPAEAEPALPTPTPTPSPIPSPTSVATAPPPPSLNVVLGEEAPQKAEAPAQNPVRTSLEKALTSPRQSVGYVYFMVAVPLILAILLTFFIRIERQHQAFLARGAALFAVVVLLLFVDMRIRNLQTEVPNNMGDLTANVIYASE